MAADTEFPDGYDMLLDLLRSHSAAPVLRTETESHQLMLSNPSTDIDFSLTDMWYDSALKSLTVLLGPADRDTQMPPTQSNHKESKTMAPHYSINELLSLRKSLPFVVCDIKKLNRDISSEIIQLPDGVRSGCKAAMYLSRNKHSRSNSWFYNSTDDDEERVVYRGHPARRSVREVSWQLRGRDSSDQSSQPLSAPSGLEAQKADNFRKFYRAVVSPTHVRVTAGGRIVPNTRAPPQPTFSWNQETHVFGSTHQPLGHNSTNCFDQQASWLKGVRLDVTDPVSHFRHSYPTIPGASIFSPSSQPIALNIVQGSIAPQKRAVDLTGISVASTTRVSAQEEQTSSPVEEITISPPNQFDTSKPFIYNGQWVYPMPPGFQPPMLPFSMLGNVSPAQPQFMTQGPVGMFFPQQLQFPMPNMVPHFPILSAAQQGSLMNFPGLAPTMVPSGSPQVINSPHGLFPAGSLVGSPTTEQQVQALQLHLKHLENQLENNKHQIDEAHVIAQREIAQSQIAALLFQSSMTKPELHPQGSASQHHGSGSQRSESSIDSTRAEASIGLGLLPTTQHQFKSSGAPLAVPKNPVTFREPKATLNQSTPKIPQPGEQSISRSLSGPLASESCTSLRSGTRKRLSAAAAMAPPFLPRSMQTTAGVAGSNSLVQGHSSIDAKSPDSFKELQKQTGTQLASTVKVTGWKTPLQHLSLTNLKPSMPTAQAMHNTIRGDLFDITPAAFHSIGSHPFAAGAGPTDPSSSHDLGEAVPYLYGFPPSGTTFEKASSSELQYSRKLTEVEQRARHLYWGKAPREALRGLPKFDGRDFYPPSPVKKSATRTFESEFTASRDSDSQETAQGWQHAPGQIGKTVGPRSFSLNETVENHDVASSKTFVPVITHKESWEAFPDKRPGYTAPINSWGVTRSAEDETFAHPTSRPSSLKGKDPCARRYEVPNIQAGANRSNNTTYGQPTFLQGMLKNSPRSSMAAVLTGFPSTTTAQGYLPHYWGSAAAALAPSMSGVNASSQGFDNIHTDACKSSGANSTASMRTENRPPLLQAHPNRDVASAADLLRKLNRQDKEPNDAGFNANTTGVGPTFSSDW